MATRNTAADVLAIIATELTASQVQPFLDLAGAWVDANLASSTIGAPILAQIEKWLAAHFIVARDPRITRVKAGPVDVSFLADKTDGAPDEYLKTAVSLDPTGTVRLAFVGVDGPQASMFVGRGFRHRRTA